MKPIEALVLQEKTERAEIANCKGSDDFTWDCCDIISRNRPIERVHYAK